MLDEVRRCRDHEIAWNAGVLDFAVQLLRSPTAVCTVRNNHEEIDVALWSGFATRPRAEQNDPQGMHGPDDAVNENIDVVGRVTHGNECSARLRGCVYG